MSYIRCLSNPEGLYIYSTMENQVCIHHCLRPPLSSTDTKGNLERTIVVPEKVFMEACHRWDHGPNQWQGPIKVGDLLVEERYVYEKTGKAVPERHTIKDYLKDRKPKRYVILFQYKAQYIMLWRVTWQYVIANVVNRKFEKFRCRWCKKRR